MSKAMQAQYCTFVQKVTAMHLHLLSVRKRICRRVGGAAKWQRTQERSDSALNQRLREPPKQR